MRVLPKSGLILLSVFAAFCLLLPGLSHYLADQKRLAWENAHVVRAVIILDSMKPVTPALQQRVLGIEVLRLTKMGLHHVTANPLGANQVVLRIPGVVDSGRLGDFLTARGWLELRLLPTGTYVARDEATGAVTTLATPTLKTIPAVLANAPCLFAGEALRVAPKAKIDAQGWAELLFGIATSPDRQRFSSITRNAVGRKLAFVVDGSLITTQEITGMIYTGSFRRKFLDPRQGDILAIQLATGPLPVPVKVEVTPWQAIP